MSDTDTEEVKNTEEIDAPNGNIIQDNANVVEQSSFG